MSRQKRKHKRHRSEQRRRLEQSLLDVGRCVGTSYKVSQVSGVVQDLESQVRARFGPYADSMLRVAKQQSVQTPKSYQQILQECLSVQAESLNE